MAGPAQEPAMAWPPPDEEQDIDLFADLGNLTFPVRANAAAQPYVDQGFRLLAAFDFRRAVLSFRAAQRRDENCAMCIWGEGFALGPNLNSFDEMGLLSSLPAAHQKAQLAASKALSTSQGRGLELSLVEALGVRYSASVEDYLLREADYTRSYAEAMLDVYTRYGPEPNLAALAADAWMNTHPWDYWVASAPGEALTLRPEAQTAMTLIEGCLERSPQHAFCVHLYVHITEASGNATLQRSVKPFAELLPQLMPGAPHLVHMAFHTLMHTGGYPLSAEDNARASRLPRQIYPLHNLETLAWTCRMQGRQQCAVQAAEKMNALALPLIDRNVFETGFPMARFVAQPWLNLVAFGSTDARVLQKSAPHDCKELYSCAIWHFTRGVVSARAGKVSRAKQELTALVHIQDEVRQSLSVGPAWSWRNFNGSRHWGVFQVQPLLQIAYQELSAFVARAEGRVEDEVLAWQEAYEVESGLAYDEPPAWYLPVGPRFSDALARHGEVARAFGVLNETLQRFPHDGWALHGMVELCTDENSNHYLAHAVECQDVRKRFDHAWQYADIHLQSGLNGVDSHQYSLMSLSTVFAHSRELAFLVAGSALSSLMCFVAPRCGRIFRRSCAKCAPCSAHYQRFPASPRSVETGAEEGVRGVM
eukprot:TRINITY_DN36612_c0_g1_i1.p1 TRINITY_DN36612_c0_g1~~TRINITY_DN36612_c0_g1_i1.p1  ORF type:complete len:662 (-),score=54.06 TRINITY_DN36612_c0_g1_i1:133-2076(-)